jgi:hypothetical protein
MKLVNGKHILTADDIRIRPDDIEIKHNGCNCADVDFLNGVIVTAEVETWFDVDARFGIRTFDTDDYITVLVNYFPHTNGIRLIYHYHNADGMVCDETNVTLHEGEYDMFIRVLKSLGIDKMVQEFKEKHNND